MRRITKLTLSALAGMVFLGGVEMALRLVDFRYAEGMLDLPLVIWNGGSDGKLLRDESFQFQFDPTTLWSPRPGAELQIGGEFISAGGFRGADPDPDASPRVLVLGDSSTFGWGVRGFETYSSLLEQALRPEFPGLAVVNGGVVGYTIRQGIVRYRQIAARWKPDVVIAAFGAVNEHYPAEDATDAAKLQSLERRSTRLAKLRKWLRQRSRLMAGIDWLADRARGGRAAMLERRRDELLIDQQTAANYLKSRQPYEARVPIEDFRRALAELHEQVQADDGELILLCMPRRIEVVPGFWPLAAYDDALREFAASNDVPLADGQRAMNEGRLEGIPETELFLDRFHPKAVGHQLLFAELLPVLRAEL